MKALDFVGEVLWYTFLWPLLLGIFYLPLRFSDYKLGRRREVTDEWS
jgi:hypothetical protein